MNEKIKQFANSIVFGSGDSILKFGNNLVKLGIVAAVSLNFVGQANAQMQGPINTNEYLNTDSHGQVDVEDYSRKQNKQTLDEFKRIKKLPNLCYTLTIKDSQSNVYENGDNLTIEPGFRYASIIPASCLDRTLSYHVSTNDLVQIRDTLLGLSNGNGKTKCFKSNGSATQRIGMVGDKCVNDIGRQTKTDVPVVSNPEELKEVALELNRLI